MRSIAVPDDLYERAAAQVPAGQSVDGEIRDWLEDAVASREATTEFSRAHRTGRTREEAAASGRQLLLRLAERQRAGAAEDTHGS